MLFSFCVIGLLSLLVSTEVSAIVSSPVRLSSSPTQMLLNETDTMFGKSNIVTNILNDLSKQYDVRLRPRFGDGPVLVNVTVLLENLGPISEVDMNFRLDMAIRQRWNDPRLVFHPPSDDFKVLSLNYEFTKKIWVPDIFFPESVQAFKHDVMLPNTLIRLHPNGDILLSSRVTVISKCPMDLSFFPMDLQKCTLLIESYGYTIDDVKLRWSSENSLENTSNFSIAQFFLLNTTLHEFSLEFSTGKFSDLSMVFILKRNITYFLMQIYLPSTMVVMLSWVSFWVSRESVPARAALAITTVLTMITLIGTTNSSLPRVSNVKALDVHFAICLLFVFGALIEFAVVCYFNKPRYNNRGIVCDYESQLALTIQEMLREGKTPPVRMREKDSLTAVYCDTGAVRVRKPGPYVDISLVDFYSRILFPASYVLITTLYWVGYTNALYEKFRYSDRDNF